MASLQDVPDQMHSVPERMHKWLLRNLQHCSNAHAKLGLLQFVQAAVHCSLDHTKVANEYGFAHTAYTTRE